MTSSPASNLTIPKQRTELTISVAEDIMPLPHVRTTSGHRRALSVKMDNALTETIMSPTANKVLSPEMKSRLISQVISPTGSGTGFAFGSVATLTPTGTRALQRTGSDVKFVGGSRIISNSTSKDEHGELRSPTRAVTFTLPIGTNTSVDDLHEASLAESIRSFNPIPSCGPQLSQVIDALHRSPFQGCDLKNLAPRQINDSMERAYSVSRGKTFDKNTVLTSNDIIVVSPPRTGQTSVLKVLDMMLHAEETSDFSEAVFASRVGWIGSVCKEPIDTKRKLYKSHLPLDHFFDRDESISEAKIVVVIRDPVVVRASWFKHVQRVFQHFHPNETFSLSADAFAAPPSLPLSPTSKTELSRASYERFIAQALKYSSRPNVHLVFYEDLVSTPMIVLSKLQQFIALGPAAKQAKFSLKGIAKSIERPDKSVRKSTLCGEGLINRATLCSIQNRWDYEVATKGPWKFPTYDEFRSHFNSSSRFQTQAESTRSTMLESRKSQAFRTSSRKRFMSVVKRESNLDSLSGQSKPKSLISNLIRMFEKKKD